MPPVAMMREAELDQLLAPPATILSLSLSLTETKTVPRIGQLDPAAKLRLGESDVEIRIDIPMTSPVLFISGPSTGSVPGKRAKGKTDSLTAIWPMSRSIGSNARQRLARHHPRRDLGDRPADGLGDERHGAAGARIDLDQIDLARP